MFALLSNQSLNVLLAVINYWNDMIERFMGLKDVVLFFCLSSCAVDISFRFERCSSLLSVIEDRFVGEESQWNATDTIALYRQQLTNLDKRIWKVITVTIFNMNTWPLLAIALLRVGGVKMPHPPLPCAYYLPQGVTSHPMTSYVVMFLLQTCCLWIFAVVGHVILSSVTVATQKSVLDFELFCEMVDRFDRCAFGHEEKGESMVEEERGKRGDGEKERGKRGVGEKESASDESWRMYSVENESVLKEQTRMLVAYHQKLYDTIKILGKNAGFGTSVSNTNICLINCIYLYIFVKTDMVVIRIFTFCYVIFSFFLVFFYCHCGQNIINRNEDVRRRLSEVAWMNRPKWFQRALILMITRSNAEVHLKPYGLYVLNHATFTNILNVSYTSSNVLKALS
ncbi:hypothetical protein LSTR_LSTR005705 [Laodelphax striatellus]|uniref:Odorant receptor n=1 Tax=Laodelphax striatellus TaxID=195883 RepID=A0A482XQI7_LAOST|nr:hypothetical protein LSTR_LSTR005705 [Laodelphax striatellus]